MIKNMGPFNKKYLVMLFIKYCGNMRELKNTVKIRVIVFKH